MKAEQQKKYKHIVFIGDEENFLQDSLVKNLKDFKIWQIVTSQNTKINPAFYPFSVKERDIEDRINKMLDTAEEILFFFFSSRKDNTAKFVNTILNSRLISDESCNIDFAFIFVNRNIDENGYRYVVYNPSLDEKGYIGDLNSFLTDLSKGMPIDEVHKKLNNPNI